MKEKLLILGAMVALCCSCAGNSVLLDTESELNGLNNEYELGTLEVSDNGLKCETLGDEDSIQVLKDNYIAEIMGRMEVAKEKEMDKVINQLVERGLMATPTIIINDRLVYVTNSYEELSRLLEYEL